MTREAAAAAKVESVPVDDKTIKKGSGSAPVRSALLRVYVKGFDASLPKKDLKRDLWEHFSKCGRVFNVLIFSSNRKAAIAFPSIEETEKAFDLDKSFLGDFRLTVYPPFSDEVMSEIAARGFSDSESDSSEDDAIEAAPVINKSVMKDEGESKVVLEKCSAKKKRKKTEKKRQKKKKVKARAAEEAAKLNIQVNDRDDSISEEGGGYSKSGLAADGTDEGESKVVLEKCSAKKKRKKTEQKKQKKKKVKARAAEEAASEGGGLSKSRLAADGTGKKRTFS